MDNKTIIEYLGAIIEAYKASKDSEWAIYKRVWLSGKDIEALMDAIAIIKEAADDQIINNNPGI